MRTTRAAIGIHSPIASNRGVSGRILLGQREGRGCRLFIAGRYILTREFGEIDEKTYGPRGKAQFTEIDTGYQWAMEFLKGRGVEKDAACAAIEWVDCKTLP